MAARAAGWLTGWLAVLALAAAVQANPEPNALPSAAPIAAPAVPAERALLLQASQAADDDPRAALRRLEEQLGTASREQRFWLTLAQARILLLLEDFPAHRLALAAATAQLARLPEPGAQLGLWLRIEQMAAAQDQQTPAQIHAQMASLRKDVRATGDARLICELVSLDLWLLTYAGSHDEAWIAAEELERCGRGEPMHLATAYAAMGQIASEMLGESEKGREPAPYFKRALEVLGEQPSRYRRSLIEWDLGNAYRRLKQLDTASSHIERARELSRSLGDRAGIAAANIALARIRLEQGAYAEMLPLLSEALLLQGHDNGARTIAARELRIRAMAALKQPQVLAEIELARALERDELQASARAKLAQAMAAGYASQQAFARAYAEMQRADALNKQHRDEVRDGQVLRLQSRYDAARRDAENAALRHQTEMASLALVSQTAQRERLVVALALLAVLATAGIALAARLWLRRRAFATLAMRDELTGSPNRRAVTTYAQAQFEQARKLAVPLTVAMLDLDHFKRVNDTHGHATGDELLRAFVAAVMPALRGQDRLGRWGGEEWLLVLPGTRVDELPPLFARMRESFASAQVAGLPAPHGQTFSMGAAALDAQTPNLAALIQAADRQLYHAKAQGRDRLAPASVQAPVAVAHTSPL